MQKKKQRALPSIIKLVFKLISTILISYAILFSLVVTFATATAIYFIYKPIQHVKSFQKNNPDETLFMKNYRVELLSENENDSLLHKFIPLDSISSFLINSVLAAEDDGFYTHPGVDIDAILDAIEYNRTQGTKKHGASTISQQLAKNFFLNTDRTYKRKFTELIYTLLLERYLGKKRILELYLNYAQWGKNIFGCEAASQFYYKKSSRTLSRSEATRLAAVLSMPSKLTPFHQTNYMSKRVGVIAQNLHLHKLINDSDYYKLTGYYPPSKSSSQNLQIEGSQDSLSESSPDSLSESSQDSLSESSTKPQDNSPKPQTDRSPKPQTDRSPKPQTDRSPKPQTDRSPKPQTDSSITVPVKE